MSKSRVQKFEQNRQNLLSNQITTEEYKLRQKLAIIFNYYLCTSESSKGIVENTMPGLTEKFFQEALDYYRSKLTFRTEHQNKIVSTKQLRENKKYQYKRQQKENIFNYLMSFATFAEIIKTVEDDELLYEVVNQAHDRWITLTLEEQLIIEDFELSLKDYKPTPKKTYSILEALTALKNKDVDEFLDHNKQSFTKIAAQIKENYPHEAKQIPLVLSCIYYLATKTQLLKLVSVDIIDKAIMHGRKLIKELSLSTEQADKDSIEILNVLLDDLGPTPASDEQRTAAVKKIEASVLARTKLVKALEPEEFTIPVKTALAHHSTKSSDDSYNALLEIKEDISRKTIKTKDITPKELKPIRLTFFKNFDGTRPSLTQELGLKHASFVNMCDWLLNYEPRMDPTPKKPEPADLLNVKLI